MSTIVWKKFKVGDLFSRSTELAIGKNQKDLDVKKEKDENHSIALISASRNGSGRVGYINENAVANSKVSINKLTFDDQWGYVYFQQEYFVITGGHNAILEPKNTQFKLFLDTYSVCYSFLSLIINKVTIKSGMFGYGYKINNKLDREIILLPCIEVSKSDFYIWEDEHKYFILAIEYIRTLLEKAREFKEQKTIRLYEAERAKYEAERAKYEAERAKYEEGYRKERPILMWKSFKLAELFTVSTEHYLNKSKKFYDISKNKTSEFCVAVCAASKNDNGIVGYIAEVEDVPYKKRKGFITKGGFGHFFYQDDWFVKPGGSWGMLDIIKFKDEKIKSLFDSNKLCYLWLSSILTYIFVPMSSYNYAVPFGREILLLPCIEHMDNSECTFEIKGKRYALAVNFISYLYLTGRINYNLKLIQNYAYSY